MNHQRRKMLAAIMQKITDVKAELETVQEEEQTYYDNMPESLQQSEKGQTAETSCYCLDEAVQAMEEVLNQIEEAMN